MVSINLKFIAGGILSDTNELWSNNHNFPEVQPSY